MNPAIRNYLVVTAGYWAFTLTDGAIRIRLGYSPFEVAMLFLFYEFFGVVTNLVGGWLGARIGLNLTMHIGMAMQVAALLMLTVPDPWLSVPYVMAAQALSGIAKDLNKMSAKASVKAITGSGGDERLFHWVAVLTGSKNTLKGAGFFLGAALLEWFGFRPALAALAGMLALTLAVTVWLLPSGVGRMRSGYGLVQASAPRLLRSRERRPGGAAARRWALLLSAIPAGMALALHAGWDAQTILIGGLALFGVVFALNSAIHSFLVLAYSEHDRVAMNVGFYYMANAGGRLAGTVLSGLIYQTQGLSGCLWWSAGMVLGAALLSLRLPEVTAPQGTAAGA